MRFWVGHSLILGVLYSIRFLRFAKLYFSVSHSRQYRSAKLTSERREIVARSSYGLNTDIWSFGALLVTCLTGVPAFHVRIPHFSRGSITY